MYFDAVSADSSPKTLFSSAGVMYGSHSLRIGRKPQSPPSKDALMIVGDPQLKCCSYTVCNFLHIDMPQAAESPPRVLPIFLQVLQPNKIANFSSAVIRYLQLLSHEESPAHRSKPQTSSTENMPEGCVIYTSPVPDSMKG